MINSSLAQIMASKYQVPLNGREMADSRAGARQVQDEFGNPVCLKVRKCFKK